MSTQKPSASPVLDSQLIASLVLHRLPGLGSGSYGRLLDTFNLPSDILIQDIDRLTHYLSEEACKQLAEYQRKGAASSLGQVVNRDLDWLSDQDDVQLFHLTHPGYPALLREIHRPPPLIYVRGNSHCLELPQLAIVGSRTPSSGGRDNAFAFARHLASNGFAITSGLALGIDGAAHAGALAGAGKTLAVFGTGIDAIYPSRHKSLAGQILAEGGALLSEFPLGTPSQAGNFPQRNRLISGLSLGTLVVEAAIQSGSLITARLAMQQNREVFAIPGSIHNPLARGCHNLIRQGATLVESAADILEHLGGMLEFKREQLHNTQKKYPASGQPKQHRQSRAEASTISDTTEEESRLLAALGHDPCLFDQLANRSGMAPGTLSALLITLELKGLIHSTPLGYERTCR